MSSPSRWRRSSSARGSACSKGSTGARSHRRSLKLSTRRSSRTCGTPSRYIDDRTHPVIQVRRLGEGPHWRQGDGRVHHTLGHHRAERNPRGVDRHPWRRHRLQFGLRADIGMWSEDTDAHGRLPAVALPPLLLSHKGVTSFPKGETDESRHVVQRHHRSKHGVLCASARWRIFVRCVAIPGTNFGEFYECELRRITLPETVWKVAVRVEWNVLWQREAPKRYHFAPLCRLKGPRNGARSDFPDSLSTHL